MTPNELNMSINAYGDNREIKSENDMFLQWLNAYWQRVEVLKPFDEMINKKKEEKKMSDSEMLANALKLNAMFGGTVE